MTDEQSDGQIYDNDTIASHDKNYKALKIPKKLNFLTCQTPTTAFAMRINKMTKGSTKAVICSSVSSNQARIYIINPSTANSTFQLLFTTVTIITLTIFLKHIKSFKTFCITYYYWFASAQL